MKQGIAMTSIHFRSIVLVLILYSLSLHEVYAKDFNTYGTSFKIVEEGFITMIKRRLSQIDIVKHQKIIAEHAQKRIQEPTPVTGLKKTTTARVSYYDPTYIVPEDIILPGGEILHKAGVKVNALEHISLDYKLFFIDARDKAQVNWFKGQAKEHDRLILVAGRPHDLEEDLQRPVYFDQFGELIQKSGIKQVPAFMEQEGTVFKIHEVKIND